MNQEIMSWERIFTEKEAGFVISEAVGVSWDKGIFTKSFEKNQKAYPDSVTWSSGKTFAPVRRGPDFSPVFEPYNNIVAIDNSYLGPKPILFMEKEFRYWCIHDPYRLTDRQSHFQTPTGLGIFNINKNITIPVEAGDWLFIAEGEFSIDDVLTPKDNAPVLIEITKSAKLKMKVLSEFVSGAQFKSLPIGEIDKE